MKTYEDAVSEAVQELIAHGHEPGPVTEHFYDRLRRDTELQRVLLGDHLPEDPEAANALIRERGTDAVHSLMNRALKRLRSGYDSG